jgi:hypothetical protein
MVRSVQTVLLSCTNNNTVSKRTKMRFHTTHVPYEFHRVRPKVFTLYWYVQCKPCSYLPSWFALSPNGPNRAPLDSRHLGVPSGAFKTIYEPMVCLMQTEHLSSTDANTFSKQIETRFQKTNITEEFHRVPPILFLSFMICSMQTCTNLASRVALSPNRLNELPLEPHHRGVPSSASKTISMVCSVQTMHLSCIKISTIS